MIVAYGHQSVHLRVYSIILQCNAHGALYLTWMKADMYVHHSSII